MDKFIMSSDTNTSNNMFPLSNPLPSQCCVCYLCRHFRKEPIDVIKTTKLCVMILKGLMDLKPDQEYFALKTDVNDFIAAHWNLLLHFRQFQQSKWRKCILDAFNHCPMIESGKDVLETRGVYKLKVTEKATLKSQKKSSGKTVKTQLSHHHKNYTDLHHDEMKDFVSIQRNEAEQALFDFEIETQYEFMTIGGEINLLIDLLKDQLIENNILLEKMEEKKSNNLFGGDFILQMKENTQYHIEKCNQFQKL